VNLNDEKLISCPFCKNKIIDMYSYDTITSQNGFFSIDCPLCNLTMTESYFLKKSSKVMAKKRIIKRWNRRK